MDFVYVHTKCIFLQHVLIIICNIYMNDGSPLSYANYFLYQLYFVLVSFKRKQHSRKKAHYKVHFKARCLHGTASCSLIVLYCSKAFVFNVAELFFHL